MSPPSNGNPVSAHQPNIKIEDGYNSLGDPLLLEKIDKLFECGVGEHVNLPHLVVVGDQSSGKSSVLEGLMKLPFPRDSGLCTRFATQIIFQRSQDEKINISIIPDPSASPQHAEKVRSWSKTEIKTLTPELFGKIMIEVHTVMGLNQPRQNPNKPSSTFSKDVLRIEIAGPNEQHLSVIDIPGIFKNTRSGLTTKADIELVRELVQGYMDNPRSVMLTVIPANVDLATQEILEMAHDADENGNRTLGVLTKPDLVDKGAESRVIDLLTGKTHPMKLGWHIVRNLGQGQLTTGTHNREDIETAFFRNTAPWNSLAADKVGVEALRGRLQDILSNHIKQEFPKVKTEISKKLKHAHKQLEGLGKERDTPEKQASFLIEVAGDFQQMLQLALSAKYGSDPHFDHDKTLRLVTAIANRSVLFAAEFDAWGHQYQYENEGDDDFEHQMNAGSNPNNPFSTPKFGSSSTPNAVKITMKDSMGLTSGALNGLQIRKEHTPEDLQGMDLADHKMIAACKKDGIMDWLEEVYHQSRGFELGTFDSGILSNTLKTQAAKWSDLTLGFVSDVICMIHEFIKKALKVICINDRMRSELLTILMDHLERQYKVAMEHTRFLLRVELENTPMTLNHYFNDNLEKCRQKRTHRDLKERATRDANLGEVVKIDEILRNHPMSNTKHMVRDIHDILRSYYKVARKRFVDCVCMQVVSALLIGSQDSPLRLLSPKLVAELDAETLGRIAGEDTYTRSRRRNLKKEVKSLEAGKKILH